MFLLFLKSLTAWMRHDYSAATPVVLLGSLCIVLAVSAAEPLAEESAVAPWICYAIASVLSTFVGWLWAYRARDWYVRERKRFLDGQTWEHENTLMRLDPNNQKWDALVKQWGEETLKTVWGLTPPGKPRV